jgi:hypothetical protein
MFENYKFKYPSRGKIIFVPTERCERKGQRIIDHISKTTVFPSFFYHYAAGGHVDALHQHSQHALFFKIDIQNFFYSINRTRVTRALRGRGMAGASTFAKWSTVKNPYGGGAFVLPIGFIQSPILASIVLLRSSVLSAIERANRDGVTVSVYLDDIIGSHDNEAVLRKAFDGIRRACADNGLAPNLQKMVEPSDAIVAFNCNLTKGSTKVTEERVAKFFEVERSELSKQSFAIYLNRVANIKSDAEG